MRNVRMMVKERDYIASLLMTKTRESFKMPETLPPIPEDDAEILAAEEYYVEHASRSLAKQLKHLSLPLDKNVENAIAAAGPKLAKLGGWPSPEPEPSDESFSDESSISSTNEIIMSTTSSGDEFQLDSNLIYHPRRRRRRYSNNI